MRRNFNYPPSIRPIIESYANQSIIYDLIEDHIRLLKLRKIRYPQHIKELPENHFLSKLLLKEDSKCKTLTLRPFISPSNLMKAYNKKYSTYRFFAAEVYYHYEPTLNNQNLDNVSDPKDFFFEVKNQSRQEKSNTLEHSINNLMQAYLNKSNQDFITTNQYQSEYVIPQGYCPLIVVKIKYQISGKSGFEYLIVRFDEHERFKYNPIEKIQTQSRRKVNLKVILQKKKIERDNRVQTQDISKKQQLKAVYKIRNVSFGWIETQQGKFQKKSHFQTYFDVRTLQNNIAYNQHNPTFTTKTYLFFKKGEYQIPRIEILSFLFDQIVLKCVIKLSDVRKVQFFSKHQLREIYLHVNTYPQYFFHTLNKNTGYTLYGIGPWQRIENFPIEHQESLAQSLFMRNMLSMNSVICIDFETGKKQFAKVVRYFQAQEIIQSELMYEKPFFETGNILENNTFRLEKKFNFILSDLKNEYRITVHHIKFSLMSLKSLQKTRMTFEDMIKLLEQIQQESFQSFEKHNSALKMLCYKPHQLLSKPFFQVYPKTLKKLQLFEKINQKYPQFQMPHLIKLEEYLEIDSISDISDIESVSEMSEAHTEILQQFVNEIQRTKLVYIPRIKLTPNGIVYAGWSMEVASKILKHYRDFEYQFLKCQISDDQDRKIQNSPHILQTYMRKSMDRMNVLNEQYVPLGWSQSQLKEGSLWYTLESKYIKTVSRQSILEFLGDFNDKKLQNPALKAARIGQNFGSSWSFDASGITFIQEDDIFADSNKEKNFSDGIGCISQINMTRFRQSLGLDSLAAVQVRFKGIKGMFSLNKELKEDTAIVRKSMIKYQTTHSQSVKYFDIIEYSKYKVGYLNRQIIVLLIANRVSEAEIMSLQSEYIKLLEKDVFEIMFENISFDDEDENLFERENDKKFESISEVFKMILSKTYQDKKLSINKLIYDQNFFKALKIEARRKLLSKLKQKCRIRVEKSVRLFGILDEFKVLGEYEVYCSIQKSSSKNKQNITGKCLLTKNPCMHPADLRVVTCVSDEQVQKRLRQKGKDPNLFEQLVNVIIFPQKGKTPLTMEISQSDLDGDEFFLCWDQRIVPFKNMDPFVIAEQVPFIERKWTGSGYEEMLDFFMEFQNFNKLGRLANNHLIQADLQGAFCKQCIELCKTHSVAVQYPKRGYDFTINQDLLCHMYPHYMQKQHPIKSYRSKSILGKLYDSILRQSNIKGYSNMQIVMQGKEANFWRLIQVDIEMGKIREIRQKFNIKTKVNEVVEKYEAKTTEDNEDLAQDLEANTKEEAEQPVSYTEVKKEFQIENDEFYKKKQVPFSKERLVEFQKSLQSHPKALSHDTKQPFSILEILNTFNYLCIFYYELKYLSELLEDQHESIYTIYFQLHTSSKSKNNLFILDRINEFRQKWLKFFAEELVNEGCYESVQDFEKFYFKQLIQKKPQFQNTAKMFQKMKEQAQKRSFIKKAASQFKENGQNNPQFLADEMANLNIVKKSIKYDTYTYQSAKNLHPLVYRKLVLFYLVSNYFSEIVKFYNIEELSNHYAGYLLLVKELPKANKFYKENQVDFMGFCWFCLPKLMVVWFRDIVKEEQARIQEKNKQEKSKLPTQMSNKVENIKKQQPKQEHLLNQTHLIQSNIKEQKNSPINSTVNKNCEIF